MAKAVAMALLVFFCLCLMGVLPSSSSSSSSSSNPIHRQLDTMENPTPPSIPRYRFGLVFNSRDWPSFKLSWKVLVGSGVGFIGAAAGSAGGIGGGGIFVPMLSLIMGFDAKTSTALSKCMIMGAAISTVYVNFKTKHPRLNIPVIDYYLVTLFQPMLLLGISIGVTLNVMFPEWLVVILFVMLCLVSSIRACMKGVQLWKKESHLKQEDIQRRQGYIKEIEGDFEDNNDDYKSIPSGPNNKMESSGFYIVWKETILLLLMWFFFLALQIIKVGTATCSTYYWLLYTLQVPAAFSLTLYESAFLYKKSRQVGLEGDVDKLSGTLSVKWSIGRISLYCFCGIVAGIMGGLVGIGGGGVMGPLFLELGLPPEVSTATATFVMLFSSSMSVVEYSFLQWFPWEYGLLLTLIALFGGFIGQYVIRWLVRALGRSSPIIFILCAVAFISACSLGSTKIITVIENIKSGVYMGFENICMAN